ncbi:palmitoyl-acyl carrier protein thioesterase, chloroplastic-like isoform X1 [Silene latifolia]|uniref:palmitoyl-acyl carrier protein thioesterase, chloroplastic-like isoform X1 n=1 Tax=Silene latifolia TaxID=37657 RepID=UPI003D7883C7
MPTISCTLPTNFPSKLPLNLPRLVPTNTNTPHLYNYGSFFTSRKSTLNVKLDNFQDPLQINDYEKFSLVVVQAENNELSKKRYAYDEYVVSQRFLIRLYELDIHQKASLEALLNYTEETGLNLFQSSGMVVEGYAVSEEMASLNLIWVIGRMQVEVNSYPSWGDIVQVETWCSAIGKHGLTCSSRLTNFKTGKKIMRVDSEFVMINKNTRRLSKILEEIKARGEPYVRENFDPITINDKVGRLRKLDVNEADNSVTGIRPMWFDLDPNQHVNNVKYISWILEGTPETVRENCELAALTVEYRRECGRENVLQSLSTASTENSLEFDHLLCMENSKEVARARTLWRSSTSE